MSENEQRVDPCRCGAKTPEASSEVNMPPYLTKFSYAPATWAKLIANPRDRRIAAEHVNYRAPGA
jgi:hypothetical protein